LAHNLAHEQKIIEDSSIVTTILPGTIDTKANREAMPDGNFNEWQKPEMMAEILYNWAEGQNRPDNGSYVAFNKINGLLSPTDPEKS